MTSCSSASSSSASSSHSQSMQIDSPAQGQKRSGDPKASESSEKIARLAQYTLSPNIASSVNFNFLDEPIGVNGPTFRTCIEQASQQNMPYTIGWLIGPKLTAPMNQESMVSMDQEPVAPMNQEFRIPMEQDLMFPMAQEPIDPMNQELTFSMEHDFTVPMDQQPIIAPMHQELTVPMEHEPVVLFDGMRLYSCLSRKENLSELPDIWDFTPAQKEILQSAQVTQTVFFATIYPGNTQFRPLPLVTVASLAEPKLRQNSLPTYFRATAPVTDCPNQAASSATSLSSDKANDWYATGNRYYQGANGMEADSEIAAFWWEKGARALHAGCSFGLACYFSDKVLVPKESAAKEANRKKSLEWLDRAAHQGHLKAMYELAANYLENRTVPEEETLTPGQRQLKAFGWLYKAAYQDHLPSMHRLAACYLENLALPEGETPTLEERQLKGAGWLLKAAKREGPNSETAYKAIANWLLPLANRGNADAQYNLAAAYADPKFHTVPVMIQVDDPSLRLSQVTLWLKKAAAQNQPEAMALLAAQNGNQPKPPENQR